MKFEGEVPVDSVHLPVGTINKFLWVGMESLAERAFEVRVFDQGDGRVRIAVDMIAAGQYTTPFTTRMRSQSCSVCDVMYPHVCYCSRCSSCINGQRVSCQSDTVI